MDQFLWMSREHLCVLVYLVTVMHSMQVGWWWVVMVTVKVTVMMMVVVMVVVVAGLPAWLVYRKLVGIPTFFKNLYLWKQRGVLSGRGQGSRAENGLEVRTAFHSLAPAIPDV